MNVPCTIAILNAVFPRTRDNHALTGPIPMAFFNENEAEIRKAMREYGVPLRTLYRGPRISNAHNNFGQPSTTMRRDAEFAMIYVK